MKTVSQKSVLIIYIIIILFSQKVYAAVEVGEHAIDNGMKVLLMEDHKAPIAIFQIWYAVGSRDEPAGLSGMSHLLEHMMFKGTKRFGPKVLSRTVQKHGGTDNAFTSYDYTAYFQILPSDKLELSMRFESDRMSNLIMDSKETASERGVVMEERRMRYEDDPQSALFEETIAAAFKSHPYGRPVIGWMSDIANIEKHDLYAHYKTHYCPDNATAVVVGDFKSEDVLAKIKKYFGAIKPCKPARRANLSEPPQRGERRVYLRKEAELPFIVMAYKAPVIPDPDSYGLDVIANILGGKSGRLYKSIVYEKKLAIDISVDYDSLMLNPYLFYVTATAAPGVDADKLESAIYEELDALKSAPPSDREMEKAVNQTEAAFIMGRDSIYMQAMMLGRMRIMGDWRLINEYEGKIRAVKAADVQAAANKYFTQDNRTVGILVPLKKDRAAGDSVR